jgi:hypothetical protein
MELTINSKKHGRKIVSFDDSDTELVLSQNTWIVHKRSDGKFYAYTQKKKDGYRQKIYMHRLIMGFPIGYDIDHKDGNGLNNTKLNLRVSTRSKNLANTGLRRGNTTGFKGVHLNKSTGKYFVRLAVGGQRNEKHGFGNPIDAAKEYNELAIRIHGEFAGLNIIPKL